MQAETETAFTAENPQTIFRFEQIQLKHKLNKETYKRICMMLEDSDKVCTIQPTGTGKSFIYLKLLQDNQHLFKNVLFISSYKTIVDLFLEKLENKRVKL